MTTLFDNNGQPYFKLWLDDEGKTQGKRLSSPDGPAVPHISETGTAPYSYDYSGEGKSKLVCLGRPSLSRYILEQLAEGTSMAEILGEGVDGGAFEEAAHDALVAIDYCLHHHKDRQAQIKSESPKATQPWTPADHAQLAQRFAAGASVRELAEELQRTQGSIQSRLVNTGLRKKLPRHHLS